MWLIIIYYIFVIRGSSNGRTPGFGPGYWGSNPYPRASEKNAPFGAFFECEQKGEKTIYASYIFTKHQYSAIVVIYNYKNMNKKIIYAIILIIAAFGVVLLINNKDGGQIESKKKEIVGTSLLNCSYVVDSQAVVLNNGYSEKVVLNSDSKIITKYFGNEASGDFNADGFTDTAFILTQDLGGSGTFYYLAVALFNERGCEGTNAVFLGDRISPQTTNFQDGKIIVNFAERKIEEPMTTLPSVGVSKYFIVNEDNLLEINQK